MTRPDHLADAAALLAAAFAGGPYETWVQPDLDRQRRTLPVLFAGVLRCCARDGGTEVVHASSGELVGVAAWVRGTAFALGPVDVARSGLWRLPLSGGFGPAATVRLLRHEHATDVALTRHVDHDTVYLWALGVAPARQGEGIARAAVDATSAAAAAAGARRLVLKTETPENVPLYRHLGFDLVAELPDAPGVPAWILARGVS